MIIDVVIWSNNICEKKLHKNILLTLNLCLCLCGQVIASDVRSEARTWGDIASDSDEDLGDNPWEGDGQVKLQLNKKLTDELDPGEKQTANLARDAEEIRRQIAELRAEKKRIIRLGKLKKQSIFDEYQPKFENAGREKENLNMSMSVLVQIDQDLQDEKKQLLGKIMALMKSKSAEKKLLNNIKIKNKAKG